MTGLFYNTFEYNPEKFVRGNGIHLLMARKTSGLARFIILLIFITLLSAGCLVSTPTPAAVPPSETPTALSATVTPTIVWFPPTATPTAFPTQAITPTADMRPKTGGVILEDDFSANHGWTLTQTDQGSIAFGKTELTIAIGEDNVYLYSLRQDPLLTDFYLELTAEPTLCRKLDEYGVLFRVTPNIDYYRFSLSCDGQVRLDRVYKGQASSPQTWLMSGAVPPGAPSSSVIGIAAHGADLRFFVNGYYQFSINDPLISSGGIGVFARSTNKMAVTVNFSHLTVYSIIP